jgi:hypothetical protein
MEGARDPFRRPISPTAMATQTAELEQAVDADENTLGAKHPDTHATREALVRVRDRRHAALLSLRRRPS